MCSNASTPTLLEEPLVLRLHPGDDLRQCIEARCRVESASWIVVSGIGSLDLAMLRYAGSEAPARLLGPWELISLAGTVSADGAHLHALVSDSEGRVLGGHVCAGCIVATTAELALLPLNSQRLGRAVDPATGYSELLISPSAQ